MEALSPYPKYINSHIPWLGNIPKHWQLLKMKYLFVERIQKGFPNEPLLAATQIKGVVPKSLYENRTVVAQKDLHLLKLVKVGDFVISLRSFEGGIEHSKYQGIISPAYTVLTPTPLVNQKYFRLLFKSHDFVQNLSLYVTGIREGQNIDYEKLSRSKLPLPSFGEQENIASFLIYKLRQIDTLINSYKKLVGFTKSISEKKKSLLAEYRARLIADVVTGKFDVREVVKNLPEIETLETTEQEPMEDDEVSDELEESEEISNADE